MIVGSGLIASALKDRRDRILYAAGVSNSACSDEAEFQRDIDRLTVYLMEPGRFVYFGTCATDDSPDVRHKLLCEQMVKARGDYLICRLPVVAGRSNNPHTLLNWLHAKVSRSETFTLWEKARRNVIDVTDVAEIVDWVGRDMRNETVDIAAPVDHSMPEIVAAMERATGKLARFNPMDKGNTYTIRTVAEPEGYSKDYLDSVIARYYR